ncbi:conserved hypothetical protein [anaerobic digester metagenome]|uniref:ABC transporter domain-containing protein n=1 Tax=anaerobic digester metagenome TaxID=1263854 RepID=A0A485LWL4_9ZZZZ
MKSRPIISVSDLFFRYPGSREKKNALERINLDIFRGVRVGILGESGSGKTTLSLILAGLEKPSSGLFFYRGMRLQGRKAYRDYSTRIQYLFQNPAGAVNRYRRIIDLVSEPLIYRNYSKETVEFVASEMLQKVGIDPLRWYDYPDQLSLGQIQRVCLARAMTTCPEILICDEPFSALDVSNRGKMEEILLQLNENHGVTLIIISHKPDSIFYLCQKILVLREGKKVDLIDVTQGEYAICEYTSKLLNKKLM